MDYQLLAVDFPSPDNFVDQVQQDTFPEMFTFITFAAGISLAFLLFRVWRS